jgi:hypothetical protein
MIHTSNIFKYVDFCILYLILGLKLFKLIFMSRRYDTGFPGSCPLLEGDNVFLVSLLKFFYVLRIITRLLLLLLVLYIATYLNLEETLLWKRRRPLPRK